MIVCCGHMHRYLFKWLQLIRGQILKLEKGMQEKINKLNSSRYDVLGPSFNGNYPMRDPHENLI